MGSKQRTSRWTCGPSLPEIGSWSADPRKYGGAGMGYVDYAPSWEELAMGRCIDRASIAAHHSLGAGHIFIGGNESQKRKYRVLRSPKGEAFAAWGLTEPSSGSDASSMRTTAVRRAGGWVLNGSKNFTPTQHLLRLCRARDHRSAPARTVFRLSSSSRNGRVHGRQKKRTSSACALATRRRWSS